MSALGYTARQLSYILQDILCIRNYPFLSSLQGASMSEWENRIDLNAEIFMQDRFFLERMTLTLIKYETNPVFRGISEILQLLANVLFILAIICRTRVTMIVMRCIVWRKECELLNWYVGLVKLFSVKLRHKRMTKAELCSDKIKKVVQINQNIPKHEVGLNALHGLLCRSRISKEMR